MSVGAGWRIIHPKLFSIGGIAFVGFVGVVSIGVLALGIWGLVVQGAIGGFIGCLALTMISLSGIRYIMGAFVAISDVAVAVGRWPGKVLKSVDRSAVVRARWQGVGRSNRGQLLDAQGVVLLTFDPLISKGQSKMIAEILGVPFTAPQLRR